MKDRNEQALAYAYFEDEPGRRTTANQTHAREARRIAANIARLPTPLGRPAVRSQRILTRRDRQSSSLGHLQRGRLQYLTTKQQLCHDRVEPFHFPVRADPKTS